MFEFETNESGEMVDWEDIDDEKDKRNKRSNDTEKNDVRTKIKGNEVVVKKNKFDKKMAVTVKDLSIKTWWRSLVTFVNPSWGRLAMPFNLRRSTQVRNHFKITEKH